MRRQFSRPTSYLCIFFWMTLWRCFVCVVRCVDNSIPPPMISNNHPKTKHENMHMHVCWACMHITTPLICYAFCPMWYAQCIPARKVLCLRKQTQHFSKLKSQTTKKTFEFDSNIFCFLVVVVSWRKQPSTKVFFILCNFTEIASDLP